MDTQTGNNQETQHPLRGQEWLLRGKGLAEGGAYTSWEIKKEDYSRKGTSKFKSLEAKESISSRTESDQHG